MSLVAAWPADKLLSQDESPAAAPCGAVVMDGNYYRFDVMVKWLLLSVPFLLAGGCATAVYPQPAPPHPTAVYLVDYGIHSSVILPTENGRYVEYAFGDWYYAALNHDWPNDALGALLISFKSTLGRRYIDVAPGQSEPRPIHPNPVRVQLLYGSRPAIDHLLQTLDARYRADGPHIVHNTDNGMDFVPDHEHYSFLNNCNNLTARCLREIGCELHGVVGFSKFDVAPVQHDLASNLARAPTERQKMAVSSAKAE